MKLIQIAPEMFAIVDDCKYDALVKFKWRAVQHRRGYYARASFLRDGRKISISMHRFIAQTPFGMVCHHLNLNSLDNRRSNLLNCSKRYHDKFHADNNILIQYDLDKLT